MPSGLTTLPPLTANGLPDTMSSRPGWPHEPCRRPSGPCAHRGCRSGLRRPPSRRSARSRGRPVRRHAGAAAPDGPCPRPARASCWRPEPAVRSVESSGRANCCRRLPPPAPRSRSRALWPRARTGCGASGPGDFDFFRAITFNQRRRRWLATKPAPDRRVRAAESPPVPVRSARLRARAITLIRARSCSRWSAGATRRPTRQSISGNSVSSGMGFSFKVRLRSGPDPSRRPVIRVGELTGDPLPGTIQPGGDRRLARAQRTRRRRRRRDRGRRRRPAPAGSPPAARRPRQDLTELRRLLGHAGSALRIGGVEPFGFGASCGRRDGCAARSRRCCAASSSGTRARRRMTAGARAPGVGVLDEILGVLARSAQSPRRAIEGVQVLTQRLWIQATHRLMMLRGLGKEMSFAPSLCRTAGY